MNRKAWIDAVKVLCMITIMMSHSCGFPMATKLIIGGFVSVFFFLSGYTCKSRGTLTESIKRKAKSLLIPYFFYGFLCVALLTVKQGLSGGSISDCFIHGNLSILYSRYCTLRDWGGQNVFLLKEGLVPIWFLPCMFLAYIWAEIYFHCSRKIWIVFVYFFAAYACTFSPILLPWSFDSSFVGAILIILGNESRRYLMEGKDKEKLRSLIQNGFFWLFSVIIFVLLVTFFGEGNFSLGDYGRYGVAGLVSFIAVGVVKSYNLGYIFKLIGENSYFTRLFAYIGIQSLRLMCLHYTIFVLLGVTEHRTYLFSFAAMIITLLISVCFGLIKERYSYKPVLRYL